MDQTYSQIPEFEKMGTLLKGSDIAKLLNVSRSFAYHLMQSGELPTVRLGHSVRVRPKDLVEYIEKNVQL